MSEQESGDGSWLELPGAGCSIHDNDESPSAIGPVVVEGSIYRYEAEPNTYVLVQHERHKGLSFQIWPSSLTLCTYAKMMHTQSVGFWKGKRVLELGAGSGLAGLTLAALGAQVRLTDLPCTMALLTSNIELNAALITRANGQAVAQPYLWGETDIASFPQQWQRPDFLVATDVVYHRELFDPLLKALAALGTSSTTVLLAHVRRWKSDKQFFVKARKTFAVTDLTSSVLKGTQHLNSHSKGAPRLFKLTRLKPSVQPSSVSAGAAGL